MHLTHSRTRTRPKQPPALRDSRTEERRKRAVSDQERHWRNNMPSEPFSTESYFQTQRAPAGLDERTERIRAFVDRWQAVEGKRVVLVTVSDTSTELCVASEADQAVEWGHDGPSRSQHVSHPRPTLRQHTNAWKCTFPRQLFGRYTRCDICRVLFIARLRRHLLASHTLVAPFLATLLALAQSLFGSVDNHPTRRDPSPITR